MADIVMAEYTGSICDDAYAYQQGIESEDSTVEEITRWSRGLQDFIAAGSATTGTYDVVVSLDGETIDEGPEPYFGNRCMWCRDECLPGDRFDATVTVFG